MTLRPYYVRVVGRGRKARASLTVISVEGEVVNRKLDAPRTRVLADKLDKALRTMVARHAEERRRRAAKGKAMTIRRNHARSPRTPKVQKEGNVR